MDHRAILDGIFSSDVFLAGHESFSTRRRLVLAPLLAALPLALSDSHFDPEQTLSVRCRRSCLHEATHTSLLSCRRAGKA
jgi:hypothetical protein